MEVRNNYKKRDLCIWATSVTRSIWKDLATDFFRYSAMTLDFVLYSPGTCGVRVCPRVLPWELPLSKLVGGEGDPQEQENGIKAVLVSTIFQK